MLSNFVLLLPLLLVVTVTGGSAGPRSLCPEDSVLLLDSGGSSSAGDLCQCIPVSQCPRPRDCPPDSQLVRLRDAVPETPGSCCPLYECRSQGPWTLSYDPSEESPQAVQQCLDGQGQPREPGEHWLDVDDPCTNCSCEASGRARCQITMCRSCVQPRARGPDECCPYCPDMPAAVQPSPQQQQQCSQTKACFLDCEHGRLRDIDNCPLCQCRPRASCPLRLNCSSKSLRCPTGYSNDPGSGCPVCRCSSTLGCLDEEQVRRFVGERWTHGPCRSCVCQSTDVIRCNDTLCSLVCTSPLPAPHGQCCRVCPPTARDSQPAGDEVDVLRPDHWTAIPIALLVVLGLLCLVMLVHLLRNHCRVATIRLEGPREVNFFGYHQQEEQPYYKSVPVSEDPILLSHAGKIVPL